MAQKEPTPNPYGTGTWTNPAVQANNRRYLAEEVPLPAPSSPPAPAPQPAPGRKPTGPQQLVYSSRPARAPRPHRRPPTRPRLGLLRRFTCTLLAILTLASGTLGALAYWANTTLVDTQNFTALTQQIAQDQDFKQNLASGITADIMASPAVSTYLGDGNSTAWYGGVQNWLYTQTEGLVASATDSTVGSTQYPELIQQVVADTHAYNFSGESRPAALDLSALYEAAEGSVNSLVPLGLETENLPGRLVFLDTGTNVYPINSTINTFLGFAGAWQTFLMVAACSALLAFALWPGNRLAHMALLAYLGAGLLWVLALLARGLSLTSSLNLPVDSTAFIFVQKMSETLTASYADFHVHLAGQVLVAAIVLTLLALLAGVLRLTARATTA